MDLLGVIAMLRRRWIVIALCIVAGVGGGYDLGHRGAKMYRATSETLVQTPNGGDIQEQVLGTQLSANLILTYSRLIGSHALLARVDATLAKEGVTTGAQNLSTNAVTNTYFIDVVASSTSPQIAQLTANAGAKALQQTVAKLQTDPESKITVKITNPAVLPTSPYTPRPKFDLLVGLILGIIAGLGLAALLEAMDRTVKTAAQGDAAVGVPLVGLIPKRRGGPVVVTADDSSPKGEPYRSLRTAIRFLDPDRPLRSILITSPTAGEGKTVTAANLGAAFALSGDRVVIIDADLRKPRLAESLGVENAVGLTSIMLKSATLDEAVQDWSPKLKVLPSGPLPPNPSEILGSQFVSTLIQDVVDRSDVTLIDAPPVLPVADALALATQVDGVILILRADETLRHDAAEAARRLEAVGANVLGYVLNAVPRNETRGAYAAYVYGPRRTPVPARAISRRPLVNDTASIYQDVTAPARPAVVVPRTTRRPAPRAAGTGTNGRALRRPLAVEADAPAVAERNGRTS